MEIEEINSLFRNTLGALVKGGYALLWEVNTIKYGLAIVFPLKINLFK